ncbi:MAG: lipopolysaccharide biosynthesis protein [Bacteroidales bacterium]|nr:lipopolysaccharide biosynthesis protein [Bacteroidales bacterium]
MNFDVNILKSKIGKDVILTFFSQLLILISLFVTNKVLSSQLSIESYGVYSIIKKNSAVISFIMLSGMGIAIPKYLSFYKAKGEENKTKSTLVSAILLILFSTILLGLLFLIFKNELTPIITGTLIDDGLFLSVIFYSFSICVSSFLYSFYRGEGDFFKYNISQMIIQILILIGSFFNFGQVLYVLNIWSIVTLLYCSYLVYDDMVIYFKGFRIKDNIKLIKSSLKELLPFGFTRLIGDFVLFSFYAVPLIITNSRFGISETAFFSTGIMISNMITPFFAFLGMILLPYVSERFALNQHRQIQKSVNILMFVYILLSVFIGFIVYFNVEFFIELFFNKKYLESTGIVKILIWSVLPQAIYLLLRNPLDAVSNFPFNTVNLTISFIVMVILFNYSNSMINISYSFLISNIILSLLSIISWYTFYYKHKNKYPNTIN